MYSSAGPTTSDILAAFTKEVETYRGEVTDTFNDGRRLFARSILPGVEEVRRGDGMQGGVALRASETEIWVHPYLFRQVCRNGAILAESLQSWHLVGLDESEADEVLQMVHEAVGACCEPDVFASTVSRVRNACDDDADMALNLMPLLSQLASLGNHRLLSQILHHFFHEGDRSRFGLANAITATARDTRDPEEKWDLEELGGGVMLDDIPTRPKTGPSPLVARV